MGGDRELISRGMAELQGGDIDAAERTCAQLLAANPQDAEALNLRASIAHQRGQWDDAVALYQSAIALRPDVAGFHNNLGISLYMAGDLAGSIAAFERAVALRPDFASAWNNLAIELRDVNRLEEARAAYRQAIALQPDYADAHKNLGFLLLLTGNYPDGFLEYEWRWRCYGAPLPRFDRPRWAGQDPAGKTIFVYEEQGYGDVIQFARYARVLADRGARVIFGCRPELGRLMACCAGVAQVLVPGQATPAFDLHSPLLSLPLFCRTATPTEIPAQVPYIKLSPDIARPWRERLGGSRAAPRVGLCWAGNRQNRNDRYRSIPLEQFAQLAAVGGIEFHSLQVGPDAADRSLVPELNLRDHGSELKDFADTAALIEQLDLVISVDTSIAHLAGALGKPVWVLLPAAPDWRWLLERTDSPWYPTARLLRVHQDWDEVLTRVANELGQWLQAFRRPEP